MRFGSYVPSSEGRTASKLTSYAYIYSTNTQVGTQKYLPGTYYTYGTISTNVLLPLTNCYCLYPLFRRFRIWYDSHPRTREAPHVVAVTSAALLESIRACYFIYTNVSTQGHPRVNSTGVFSRVLLFLSHLVHRSLPPKIPTLVLQLKAAFLKSTFD